MDRDLALQMAESIDGWHRPVELEWLYDTAHTLPPGASWVEVGVWKGKSACAVAGGLLGTLWCVDDYSGGSERALQAEVRMTDVPGQFLELASVLERSTDCLIRTVGIPSPKASDTFEDCTQDVIYIDADHGYGSVKADIEAWMPKVRIGGLLCGHDYMDGWPGVTMAVDEMLPGVARPVGHIWCWRKPIPREVKTCEL